MNIDFSDKSKTKEGRIEILKEIYGSTRGISHKNEELCWEMYHNSFEESEYEYLRKFGDYELPASVKHIPKQRPYVDYLVSRQARRPFVFSVNVSDESSLKKKYKNKVKDYLDKYLREYKQIFQVNRAKIEQLEQSKQTLVQQMQQQPQSEEEAQQLASLQAQLPAIMGQIEYIKETILQQQIHTEKQIKHIERYYRYDKKELVEELAQKGLRSLRQKLKIKNISLKNFISYVVTGKQYYYVDYRVGDKVCTYRSILTNKVFYPATEDVEWVQDLDWAGFEEQMTLTDVLSEFGDRMKEGERKKLKERHMRLQSSKGGIFVATTGQKAIPDLSNVESGSTNPDDGINVARVWWIAERKLEAIESPNPYNEDDSFIHFIPPNKEVINAEEYTYKSRKRTYINNEDDNIRKEEVDVEPYNKTKGQKYHKRVVYDLYYGVVIDDFIFIADKSETQPRYVDNYSKTTLPIIGPTFNNITARPYSYLWATKDIQKLYNIVNYHRELMLAVAGTKVMLMDMYQKPEGMSDDEWRYKMKMGVAEIQSRKKGIGPGLQPTFNQFQVYDMSLSSSIQYLDKILEGLDDQMGMIMGVTRAAMGQVVKTDQVGTFEMSQQSAALVTEILYAKHDEIECQALNALLHLSKTYLWDKETIIQMITPDGAEELVKMPADTLNLADYLITMINNTKEESSLSELKQIMLGLHSKGQMPLETFIQAYRVESLMELEKMAEYYSEKMAEVAQQSAMNEDERKAKLKELEIKLQGEIDMKIKEQEGMLEQAKLKVDQQRLALEQQIKEAEQQLKEKELAQDRYLKMFELVNERESEDNAVMLNDKHSTVDEQIRLLELKINSVISASQIEQSERENKRSDKQQMAKVAVEDKKARKIVKEHISDK